jgi:hypothetical protein
MRWRYLVIKYGFLFEIAHPHQPKLQQNIISQQYKQILF